jgi:hypothetical protein
MLLAHRNRGGFDRPYRLERPWTFYRFPVTTHKRDVIFFYPGGSASGCTRSGKVIPNVAGVGRNRWENKRYSDHRRFWVQTSQLRNSNQYLFSGIKCEYSKP